MNSLVRLLWTSFCFTPLLIPAAIAQTEIPSLPKADVLNITPPWGSLLQAQTPDSPPSTTPDLTTLQIKPRWGIGYSTSGAGYDGFTRLDSFLPLLQNPGSTLTFLEGRLQLDNSANVGGNLLFGHRFYNQSLNRIFGGYLGFDRRDTGNSTFHQLGVGLETLGEVWDVRLNGYFPLGDTRDLVDETAFDTGFQLTDRFFSDHFLVVQGQRQRGQVRHFEAAMTGFDLEVGARLAQWGEGGGLRGYGGLYYYDATGSDSSLGWRMRLEVQPTDSLNFGVALQEDQIFGTNVIVSVGAIFGKTRSSGNASILSRLGDGVERISSITVDSQTESDFFSEDITTAATNPQTSEPYIFQHVNLGASGGNGTVETPFGTVDSALAATRSDGNDIVYVQAGTNPGIPAFTIPDQVQVLSTAPIQQLDTVEFERVQLPLSGAGVFPQVMDTVTLGNNTVLSGFTITGVTNPGIVARGIQNGEVRDSMITSSSQAGVLLENTGGLISFTNSAITGNGVPSLSVTSVNDVAIANSTLTSTNSATEGISIDAVSGNFDISDSTITITNPTSNGILATAIEGTATISANPGSLITTEGNQAGISLTESIGEINLSGVTVESTEGAVVEVSNINNGAIANSTLTSTNSATEGIYLDTVDGNFEISDSTIMIGNPTSNGILATNIQGTATISANPGSQITTQGNQAGISLTESTGEINLSGITVESTGGAVVEVRNINNSAIANSTLSSTNSATEGIYLDTVNGNFDISDSTITIENPTSNGILATAIEGTATISANPGSQITTQGNQAGISLTESTGEINLSGVTVSSTEGAVVEVSNINNGAIANSTLTSTNSATEGIYLDTVNGNFEISDSTITIENPASNGILATAIQGSATISANQGSQITTEGNQAGISLTDSTGEINLSGVTVESTEGKVVEVRNINNGAIANSTLSSTNSATEGIYLDTVNGNFDISDSTITIENPTSNAILATNIQGIATIAANQGSQITTTTANAGILLAESLGTINLTGLEVNSTNGAALVGTTINNATISDSTLTSINSSTNGISLNGISGIVDISNSTITITNPLDNINGISVGNVTGTVNIAANEGSQITQANQGIELFNSTGAIAISGFAIRNTDDSGISGINLGNVTLANNRIEGATNEGIYLADTDGEVTISQNTIINIIGVEAPDPDPTNPLDFPTGQGILLNNVTGSVEVSLNTISGTMGFKPGSPIPPSGQGIVINNDTGSVNITLSDNSLFDNYEDAILIGLGVPFGDPIVNLTIEGNTIENNGGSNPTRGDGIGIGLEGNTIIENLTISENTIRNNGDEGIDIRLASLDFSLSPIPIPNSTAIIQAAIIENNTMENNFEQGINFELSDDTEVWANILSNILMNVSTDIVVKSNNNSEICIYLSENINATSPNLNGITPNNSPCF
ncbi:MAG: right-handed parallel beta-helix repeat-containing protein [Coleofasciculus sp. A1-SPW-01]|uniref:right-handed parallel beta-helix repeat-containing protein n=1 Tax=Coleofasciculus sp. A1-SPW-01 TaxID=3070819 RepID=UPI003303BCE3